MENSSHTVSLEQALKIAMHHHQAGQLPEAESVYRKILEVMPNHPEALHYLGVIAHQVKKNVIAIEFIEKAIAVNPSFLMYCNLGLILQKEGRLDEAEQNFRKALSIQPDHPQAHFYLGSVLHQQGKFDEALVKYHAALSLLPHYAEVHHNIGIVLQSQRKLEAAIDSYRKAVSSKPDYAEAWNNMGSIFKEQGKFDAALENYRQALFIQPDYAEAHNNIGEILKYQHKFNEAIESYRTALTIKPDYAEVQSNLALLLLSLGQFEEGWKLYRVRYALSMQEKRIIPSGFAFPQWQGESLSEKSILIWHEQGLGDEIQFCRYAFLLKRLGAKHITWVCKQPLKAVLQTLDAIDVVCTDEDSRTLEAHDYWTFPMDIPLYCNPATMHGPVSWKVPYLYAKPERIAELAFQLRDIKETRVGICWKGGIGYKQDAERSPGMAPFMPLFSLSHVCFFSLIPGTRSELIEAAGNAVGDLGHEIDAFTASFEETAALIMNLDLIITCDTSIGHLAGALGKPVWLVLPFVPDWRWGMERDDNDWYPHTRLFRQSHYGNWADVFKRVRSQLALFRANPP